jgi:hypothetical protein
VLIGTASPELSLLSRPERHYGGSKRLVRVEMPTDHRLPALTQPPATRAVDTVARGGPGRRP